MNLWVMRHSQTNYNLPGFCNDDPRDDAHLTALGRQQAARVVVAHEETLLVFASCEVMNCWR